MAVLGSGKVEIDTYGELKTLIAAVTKKQKGLKIKGVVIDAIADELVGKLPGGALAKNLLNFVKASYNKPDTVKTNTWLDRLDVDDEFSAIVDDTIENSFLQSISKRIESQPDNTPLRKDFNMNTELIDYLGKKHKGRTVAGPQNENKKMKKSQLRELVKEVMAKGFALNPQTGKLESHDDDFTSTKLSSLLFQIANSRPEEKQKYQGDPEEGERILTQKSNPENVARILRGEKPIYEEQGQTFNKQQLIDYLNSLPPEMKVAIPQIHMTGNFDRNAGWRTTAAKASQALSDTPKEGEFKLSQDNPTYKNISLVQSDEEMRRMEKSVRWKD